MFIIKVHVYFTNWHKYGMQPETRIYKGERIEKAFSMYRKDANQLDLAIYEPPIIYAITEE